MPPSRSPAAVPRLLEWPAWTRRVEVALLSPFVVLWVVGVLAGLPVSVPDGEGFSFVERHYFRPIGVALILQAIVLRLARRREGPSHSKGASAPIVALLLLTTASVFLHMNFKAWMPLVHPRMFDAELLATDRWFGSLVSDLVQVRQLLSGSLWMSTGIDLDPLYHFLFVAMFFSSASAHAVLDTPAGFRRLVVATCAVLLLGGVAYWILPARGPFVFRQSVSSAAAGAQAHMLQIFEEVTRTRSLPPGSFVTPLAAMPSLHTAHAVVFTWFASERVRPLLFAYIPILYFILFEAVVSGWHYVLDLPAGAALAAGIIWVVRRVVPENEAEPGAERPANGALTSSTPGAAT